MSSGDYVVQTQPYSVTREKRDAAPFEACSEG